MDTYPAEVQAFIDKHIIPGEDICECGGKFKFTGTVFEVYPPLYGHKCNKCGKTIEFWKAYN